MIQMNQIIFIKGVIGKIFILKDIPNKLGNQQILRGFEKNRYDHGYLKMQISSSSASESEARTSFSN